jgi:hypothetical protein
MILLRFFKLLNFSYWPLAVGRWLCCTLDGRTQSAAKPTAKSQKPHFCQQPTAKSQKLLSSQQLTANSQKLKFVVIIMIDSFIPECPDT